VHRRSLTRRTSPSRPNALRTAHRGVAYLMVLEFLVGIWRVGMIQQLCRWPFQFDFVSIVGRHRTFSMS
jgi:hypothetical protein